MPRGERRSGAPAAAGAGGRGVARTRPPARAGSPVSPQIPPFGARPSAPSRAAMSGRCFLSSPSPKGDPTVQIQFGHIFPLYARARFRGRGDTRSVIHARSSKLVLFAVGTGVLFVRPAGGIRKIWWRRLGRGGSPGPASVFSAAPHALGGGPCGASCGHPAPRGAPSTPPGVPCLSPHPGVLKAAGTRGDVPKTRPRGCVPWGCWWGRGVLCGSPGTLRCPLGPPKCPPRPHHGAFMLSFALL